LRRNNQTRLKFFKIIPGLKIFRAKKIRIEKLPLPDPPWFRVEEFLGKFTSQIPHEIKVFFAYLKRGVGQGQTGKKRSRLKIFSYGLMRKTFRKDAGL